MEKFVINMLSELNMSNSSNVDINILDLPDEILFKILNNLNTIDAIYSFFDVNQRFNRIILDFQCVRDLDLSIMMDMDPMYIKNSSLNSEFISKICKKILPRIAHHVHKLIVEQYSMRKILHAVNYPLLYSLTLKNFDDKILCNYLRSKINLFI